MNILHSYKNGNYFVKIYDDGTKERIFDNTPEPEFPESIDCKITNFCDAKCSFCHESSTTDGVHGDINKIIEVFNDLPSGVEIAIGGGAAQSHPQFEYFVKTLSDKGLIPNLTINQKHISRDFDILKPLIENKNIYGVGISYNSNHYLKDIEKYLEISDNIVFHMILGINKLSDIDDLNSLCNKFNKKCKVLLLGYKNFGFGINYYLKNSTIESNKKQWYMYLPKYFNSNVISFDNLAIQQLNVKRFFTKEGWDCFYMGDEFTHSMYVDGVEQKYSPSSTVDKSKRVSFDDMSLLSYFSNYRSRNV